MPRYSQDEYTESVVATYEELTTDPDQVAWRLVGRLNRALGGPEARLPG